MASKFAEAGFCGFAFYILYVLDVRGERVITEV